MQGLIDYFTPKGQINTLTLNKGRTAFNQALLEWNPNKGTWAISLLESNANIKVNGRTLIGGASLQLNHLDSLNVGQVRARFFRIPDTPLLRSKACAEVLLGQQKLLIGRFENTNPADNTATSGQDKWLLDPDDRSISNLHVEIHPDSSGYIIHDRSRTGTYLNGAVFQQRLLLPGDRFNISSYFFEFTGTSIRCVDQLLGARVEGSNLELSVPSGGKLKRILRSLSIELKAGEFIGILGGSGQGKSTLMNLLAGLTLPTKGAVLIDGESIEKKLPSGSMVGFVPQDDIVHSELTVKEAITLTARLRLAVSRTAINTLVSSTIKKLGLDHHENQSIHSLSGGQRKRVNIATELLARPSVLFLDEPTSGLDPENEESVISTLQNLRLIGQTVVCTTHSLQKAYLFDRIAFIHDGRLLFLGTQDEAREHFLEIKEDDKKTETSGPSVRLEGIYKLVSQQKDVEKWHQKFLNSNLIPSAFNSSPPPRRVVQKQPQHARPSFFNNLWVLVTIQWRILISDKKNWQSILTQSLGIGVLAGWVGQHDPEFRFFACLIATLWFGCSNAAQTIVRELPIFKRERIAGLGLHPYIISKTLFLSFISWAQVVMLIFAQALPVLIFIGDDNPAHDLLPLSGLGLGLFLLAFSLTGVVGVQIGLALSSLARTTTQASLWVPLALIPQILFSGFVVTLPEMPTLARYFSYLVPSASAQRLIDAANIAGKRVPLMTDKTEVPLFFWTNFKKDNNGEWEIRPGTNEQRLEPKPVKVDEKLSYRELDEYNTSWQNIFVNLNKVGTYKPQNEEEYVAHRNDVKEKAGDLYNDPMLQSLGAIAGLIFWILACYGIIWFGLAMAQPAPLRPRWFSNLRFLRI